jgi:hypothetical protein
VDAHAVEAEFLDEFHLPPDGLVARRRQVRPRPIVLGQDQAQEQGHAVQQQPAVHGFDPAQAEIALDQVEHGAVGRQQLDRGVDQVGMVGRPAHLTEPVHAPGQNDLAVQHRPVQRVGVVRQRPPAERQAQAESGRPGRAPAHPQSHLDGEAVRVGGPPHRLDEGFAQRLQPDRLPDARGPVVPDLRRLGLPVLLPARLGQIQRVVVDAHDDDLLGLGGEPRGDVEGEGRVPSLVTSGELAVHPDLGLVVHRAERQVQPRRSPGRGELEHAAVPNDRVVASLLDAARRGLGWKGDEDLPVEDFGAPRPTFLDPTILVVEGEAPRGPADRSTRTGGAELEGAWPAQSTVASNVSILGDG